MRLGDRGLEVLERFAEVHDDRLRAATFLLGRFLHDHDIVPVAVVLSEITKALIWVPKEVLAPEIVRIVDIDSPHLKADHLVWLAFELAARA